MCVCFRSSVHKQSMHGCGSSKPCSLSLHWIAIVYIFFAYIFLFIYFYLILKSDTLTIKLDYFYFILCNL